MAIADHLNDIDFRTRGERQKQMIPDFIEWYETLQAHQSLVYDDKAQSQIMILSSVLWYLLPEKDYRKLTKHK